MFFGGEFSGGFRGALRICSSAFANTLQRLRSRAVPRSMPSSGEPLQRARGWCRGSCHREERLRCPYRQRPSSSARASRPGVPHSLSPAPGSRPWAHQSVRSRSDGTVPPCRSPCRACWRWSSVLPLYGPQRPVVRALDPWPGTAQTSAFTFFRTRRSASSNVAGRGGDQAVRGAQPPAARQPT